MLGLHVTNTHTSCGPYTASVGAVNVRNQQFLAAHAYVRVSIRHEVHAIQVLHTSYPGCILIRP